MRLDQTVPYICEQLKSCKCIQLQYTAKLIYTITVDNSFGFMKGKGTTDAIFIVRQMQEKFRAKGKKLYSILALWIWKKLLIEFREK